MIRYVKYQNNNEGSKAYGKWYLRAVTDETVDVEGLASHMAKHNTTFSKGNIMGMLTDAVSCIKELMLEGKAVKLQNLAIFKIGLVSNGAATAEDAKATLVTGFRFNAKATGEMSIASLKQEIQLKELKHYVGGEDFEDDNDPNGGGGNSQQGGGGNSNNQQGSQGQQGNQNQQTTPKYTLTLKKADNSVISTTELEAGATITYPTATSGYMWPSDAPTVMPAEATTVSEVVDDDPNVL